LGLGMGLDGAALGLNLSRCVMLVQALRFAVGTHDLMARPAVADVLETLRPYLAIAIPAILAQQAAPVGNYLLTSVMAGFGDQAMAGWAVVGRLTVVAFGGVFSLAGAIGGIFGQNYGARDYARLRSTYRDALIFGLIYTVVTWALLAAAGPYVVRGFGLEGEGAQVVTTFVTIGAGAFVFAAALFVANSAFNALGRPTWATLASWTRDGILTWPAAIWLGSLFGAAGVIYAQALVAIVSGVLVCWLGWRYVLGLERQDLPPLDLEPPRPYAHADRFRRR
ncbi:MATE family efflux transporter, partial [Cribrihabitans sp. XS_ASV171]